MADLDTIMHTLNSDRSRLAFLKRIYEPGNTDVADRILALSKDAGIIEKEVAHAIEKGDTDRFQDMARAHIDYYTENDFDILLRKTILKWGDAGLAEYAIAKMTSKPKDGRNLEGPFEYAADIAEAFGNKDKARELLESLLELQRADCEYKFPIAKTLVKLGRYGEAIDMYLADESHWFNDAFRIAQEHVPERVTEVAQKGFDAYKRGGNVPFYVECAKVLGKTRKAEKTVVRDARKINKDESPRYYQGMAEALMSLGRESEAKALVKSVAAFYEAKRLTGGAHSDSDGHREMARLYHAVGDTDGVKAVYTEGIQRRIRQRHHPSNTMEDIRAVVELTGDVSFREIEIQLLEEQREYEKAAALATTLGRADLSEIYSQMHRMSAEAEAKRNN